MLVPCTINEKIYRYFTVASCYVNSYIYFRQYNFCIDILYLCIYYIFQPFDHHQVFSAANSECTYLKIIVRPKKLCIVYLYRSSVDGNK
jgi:hypothetical protein